MIYDADNKPYVTELERVGRQIGAVLQKRCLEFAAGAFVAHRVSSVLVDPRGNEISMPGNVIGRTISIRRPDRFTRADPAGGEA